MAQYWLVFAVIPVVHYNITEPKCQGELVQSVYPRTVGKCNTVCHCERPEGAKQSPDLAKRDCFVAEFILSLSKGSSK